jgi:hypothetical protein
LGEYDDNGLDDLLPDPEELVHEGTPEEAGEEDDVEEIWEELAR